MARIPKTPSFPFYGKDAYDDEVFDALSFAAQGLYLRLAWWQWSEGSIPADLERILDKIPRRKIAEARKVWPSVEPLFPVTDGERRRNETVEVHRRRVCSIRDKNAEGAEITNAKRWGKRSDTVSLSESDSDTDSESLRARAHVANANAVEELSSYKAPEGVQGEISTIPPRPVLERIALALEPSGMMVGGGYIAAWVTQYGGEFVAAVIEDVGPTLTGKRPAYLHAILKDRHAAGWKPTQRKPSTVIYSEQPKQSVTVDEVREVKWALENDALDQFGCTADQARAYLDAVVRDGELVPNAPPLADYLHRLPIGGVA